MIVHEWSSGATDPVEEGRGLGERWAPQLRTTLADYRELFRASGISDAVAVADACGSAVAEHAPELWAEYAGMAEGSGLTVSETMLLAARTEILAGMAPALECSTIVHVPSDGSAPRTLQTWDWQEMLAAETVVRRIRSASGARVATFCEFGQPAKIGVNDRGLGVHFNILHHDSDGSRPGVPVHVLARMVLDRASTVAEAEAVIRSVPLAASSVLTVVAHPSSGPEAASIEVAPVGVAVIPVAPGTTLAHTNSFLDPELAEGDHPPYETTSAARLDCLVDAAELAEIRNPRERALAFGAIPGAPISVRPRQDEAPPLRWESKLTVAIEVDAAELQFSVGAPADVADADWRSVAA